MKKIIIYTLIATSFLNCNNDNDIIDNIQTNLKSDYLKVISKNNNIKNLISSSTSDIRQLNFPRNYSISNDNQLNEISKLSKNNTQILFGKNVDENLRIVDSKNSRITESSYIPKEITGSIDDKYAPESIKAGDVIEWNYDKNNTNGVFVHISYAPSQAQGSYNLGLHTEHREWAFVVHENQGSYTLTESDLSTIPKNAILDVTIGRGALVNNTFIQSNVQSTLTVK